MARMLDGGEEPKFIARRMVVLASEDVGNADPMALTLATSCFTAVDYVGMPEARIILAQTAAYLAAAPKSNAAYMAIEEALEDVRSVPNLPVPLHIRNAPTQLMKDLDYGKEYYYKPTEIGREKEIRDRLNKLWKKKQR
jgi:putative ATPase